MNGFIDIKKLTLEELSGVVNLYPWFAYARKELCARMAEVGDGAWSEDRFAESALFMGSRKIIASLARKGSRTLYSDENLRSVMRGGSEESEGMNKIREGYRGVGDYFSADSYKKAGKEEDSMFSAFAKPGREIVSENLTPEDMSDFYTETLAQVYLEQGYTAQALDIYSKLILRYPEKSVYFAGLIEKIKNL